MRRTIAALAAGVMLGCGGGSASSEGASEPAQAPPVAEEEGSISASCVGVMNRELECADEFIPALVELRVRLDQPPGVAAQDASEGREALVAQARAEYETHATPETIRANCAQLSEIEEAQANEWNVMMQECLAAPDCGAFTACDVRFTEHRFTSR